MSDLLLYSTEYPEPLPPELLHSLLELLPFELQQKALKYRQWQDVHASLLGKLLLRKALEKMGRSSDLSRLQYTEYNKPLLPQGPPFSISHSGNRVVLLISARRRVGIDIESLTPLRFEDFQSHFTPKEWEVIHSAESPLEQFYHFWTAKESLLKADGRGLGVPLQDLDLSQDEKFVSLDNQLWFVRSLPLYEGYACHIAVKGTKRITPLATFEPDPVDILHASRDWASF